MWQHVLKEENQLNSFQNKIIIMPKNEPPPISLHLNKWQHEAVSVITVSSIKSSDHLFLLRGDSVCEGRAQTSQTRKHLCPSSVINLLIFCVQRIEQDDMCSHDLKQNISGQRLASGVGPNPTVCCLFLCIKAAVLSCDSTSQTDYIQHGVKWEQTWVHANTEMQFICVWLRA